jgi:hypothetical protein
MLVMLAIWAGTALTVLLLSPSAHAQARDGQLDGVTRNSAGTPLPEVQIVAHSLDRGTDQSTLTDANGLYNLPIDGTISRIAR